MKSFTQYLDEEWKTISGNHVLIGKDGKIEAGMGKGKTVKAAVQSLIDKADSKKEESAKPKQIKQPKDMKSFKEVLKSSSAGNKAHASADLDIKKHGIDKVHLVDYSGAAYTDINDHFRKKGKVDAYKKKIISTLDKAFTHAETKEDLVVYRGFSSNIAAKLKDGDVFEDPEYSSTTADADRANIYARGDDAVIFKIHVPKGSKAMSLKDHSQFPNESEILLNRGSKFRVVGKEKKTRTRKETVYVELVND